MELPNPPWYRRWSVILAGVIGVAAVVALLGLRGLQETDPPVTTTAALAQTTTVTATTAAVAAPTTTRQPQSTTLPSEVLWTGAGNDVGKSRGFRAPSSWHIEWSFDCANFRKFGGGNFKITGDGAFEDIQIQEFDTGASGSRTFSRGGYGHLLIDSVCRRWTVTAVAD
jgi:hypothetical protein